MSSTFKVPLTTIQEVLPHPNADRLVIYRVYGFFIIGGKDSYKVGDQVLFIPPASILPQWIENIIFKGSKLDRKGSKNRIKQIRIRGVPSEGLIISPSALLPKEKNLKLEEDYSNVLEITKYEPPQPGFAQTIGKDKQRNRKCDHPLFHKMNGIENIKWYPDLFTSEEEVIVQEKLHGSNCRAGYLPYNANTLWKKFKKLIGFAPSHEWVYGSNNVDITARSGYSGFYGEDVYGNVLKSVKAKDKVFPNEIIYGELIGEGIQKNYSYGHLTHHFVLFDVKVVQEDGSLKWMNPEEVEAYAKDRGFSFVPVLYRGQYNRSLVESLVSGPSVYCPEQKVREGIVIKSRYGYHQESGNKKALKWINPKYLDDDTNTEFN